MNLKYTLLILVIMTLSFNTLLTRVGFAQVKNLNDIYITLDINNATLKQTLKIIERKTDFNFTYSTEMLDKDQRLNLQIVNKTLATSLLEIAKQANLRFRRVNNTISVMQLSADDRNNQMLTDVFNEKRISGKITDENGDALPGVNILIKETAFGVTTDIKGKYQINVPADATALLVSYIGYLTNNVSINNRAQIDIQLFPDITTLSGVVVTAFGVEKSSRKLSYAVSELSNKEFAESRNINVGNALQGKVAGVVVSKPSSGPGGSTRVVIRGNASINQNNQPLFVVDGIPITNNNLDAAGEWGGYDTGDGLSSLNQDDIEKISILKGPTASALYGSRGQHGVILITTKTGEPRKGIGIEFNSNFTFESLIDYSDFQQEYGLGSNGNVPATQAEALASGAKSWGAKYNRLDNAQSQAVYFDGETRPYSFHPDNRKNFYRKGITWNNTLALTAGNEKSTMRASFSNLKNQGILPNSSINKYFINLRGSAQITSKLFADVKINYIFEDVKNRPPLSDHLNNPERALVQLPGTIDVSLLSNYIDSKGNHIAWNSDQFLPNPYWGTNENLNFDDKNRLLGFGLLKYEFTDWLSLQLRAGTDFYNHRITQYDREGTPWAIEGKIKEKSYKIRENNYDFLFQFNKKFDDWTVESTMGSSRRDQRGEIIEWSGSNFKVPGFYHISNTSANLIINNYPYNERTVTSVYGSVQIGYRNLLFFEVTGRNDWSSNLPLQNNSYFYPSVGMSWVFIESFTLPDWINYGKLRGSFAQVGSDGISSLLFQRYRIGNTLGNGALIFQIDGGAIPNPDLKPEATNSYEFGVELQMFNDRLIFDLATYKSNTSDFILNLPISTGSTYESILINSGEVQNKGIELSLSGRLVKKDDLTWDVAINYAKNKNTVVSLFKDSKTGMEMSKIRLGSSRSLDEIQTIAQPGEPMFTLWGNGYIRDPQGNIVHNADGTVKRPDEQINLGKATPDWTGGFTNTLSYKNFTLNALIHVSQGGKIYSRSNASAYRNGKHKATLANRTDFVPSGVVEVTNSEGDVTGYSEVTASINSELYYDRLTGNIAEKFVYDASFIKLRELSIGYKLPQTLLTKTAIQSAKFSIIGRNLWLISSNVPNIDPESTYSANNNGVGLEDNAFPTTRSLGFNLNLTF